MTAPDLPAFLIARLDEDEADAHAAAEVNPPPWHLHVSQMTGDTGLVMGGETPANRYLGGALWDNEGAESLSMEVPTARHIARHDPARVLADCAAKRRIVEEFVRLDGNRARLTDAALHLQWNTLRQVVELLAQPHADHPAFDPAWRV